MKRWKNLAVVMAAVAALGGVAAGCGGSSSSEASTPANATTAANTATQTDSQGATVTTPTEATTAASTEGTETGAAPAGDVAAGKATFESVCQGCHGNGGQDAGVGPKLAGLGRTPDQIKSQIQKPIGTMPPNLVSGADEDNVVAFVASIQ